MTISITTNTDFCARPHAKQSIDLCRLFNLILKIFSQVGTTTVTAHSGTWGYLANLSILVKVTH